MTSTPKKKICIYTLLSWTLMILALAFRILARLFSYDAEIGYFESGAVFPVLYRLSLALLAILAISAIFVFRRSEPPKAVLSAMKETCIMEKAAAMVGAIGMFVASVATVLYYWIAEKLLPSGFTLFGLITCVLSVFFFLLFWAPSHCGKNLHIFSGFAFVLHYVYILAVSYFELYTPMNNPVKLLIQLTAIAAIFYLLTDLRFYMDIARPSRYVFSSILFLGFASVSVLSGGLFSVPTEEYTLLYHLYNIVNLSLLVPAAVRVMRMLSLWVQSEDISGNADKSTESSALPASDGANAPTPNEATDNADIDTITETRQDTEQ